MKEVTYVNLFLSYTLPCSCVLTVRTDGGPSPIAVKADTLIV